MATDRIAGYVRVSRVAGRNGDSFQSPGAQEDSIRSSVRNGERLLEVVHELDASGGTMQRRELQRLIREIEAGRLDGIVCARLDRFARTVQGGLSAIEQIHEAGGFVRFIADGIDTSASGNAMGKLQLQILLAVAEWQRASTGEYIEESKESAVARGVHIAGRVPFGYRRPHKGAPLALDGAKADALGQAFKLRAGGASLGAVCRLLDELAPGGPSGKGSWTRGTVTRLLRNPVYTGEARQGKHVKAGAHPAIADRETFDTVQALARVHEPPADFRAKCLLAGLIRCGSCGYAMQKTTIRQREQRFTVYRCRGKSGSGGRCPAPTSCMAPAVEELVEQAFLERDLTGLDVEAEATDEAEVAEVRERLAVLEVQAANYRVPAFVAELGVDAATSVLAKINVEQAHLEQRLGELVQAGGRDDVDLGAAVKLWPTLSVDERREVLTAAIDAVIVSRGPARRAPLAPRVDIRFVGDGEPFVRPVRHANVVAGVTAA